MMDPDLASLKEHGERVRAKAEARGKPLTRLCGCTVHKAGHVPVVEVKVREDGSAGYTCKCGRSCAVGSIELARLREAQQ